MTFKAGDKVRHKDTVGPWAGWEGTVHAEVGGVTTAFSDAFNGYGSEVRLTTSNLELITPTFTFADIQVGDRIRRTLTRPSGTTEVREGVVAQKSALYAMDTTPGKTAAINYILAYDSDGHPDKPQVVLELLDRPKPKHWTETKPVGSVALHTHVSGPLVKTVKKVAEGTWEVKYLSNNNTFVRTDEEIQESFADLTPEDPRWRWIS